MGIIWDTGTLIESETFWYCYPAFIPSSPAGLSNINTRVVRFDFHKQPGCIPSVREIYPQVDLSSAMTQGPVDRETDKSL